MKKLTSITALKRYLFILITFISFSCTSSADETASNDSTITSVQTTEGNDPLAAWNDGPRKQAVVNYVINATEDGNAGFIPVNDRITVFDNDGTLWSEQPLYFQFFYSFDKIRQMSPQHPEWKTKEPFKSILAGDIRSALASGEKGLMSIMGATFSGMSADKFDSSVKQWADTAKHPITKKNYTEMIYQPMLELLQYLRANGFQTFIVSGGDISFMRAWAEKMYGIPPQQVIGSSFKVKYDSTGIERLPQFDFMDDGAGKPVGIYQHIGKKPVFAAGNSDGDYQMLQFTGTNTLPHMEIIVHHTDSIREWAYDRGSPIGKLEQGLDDAPKYGWVLIDMQKDWKRIYPFNK
jgi:phosphoglycolate phosphatase-like HAD superfamily hydrolase